MAHGLHQTTLFGEPIPLREHWRMRQTPGLLKSARHQTRRPQAAPVGI